MLDQKDTISLFICIIAGSIMIILLFTINYPIDKGYVKLYENPYDIRNFKHEWSLTYSLFSIPMGVMIVCLMWFLELDNIYDVINYGRFKEYYKKELIIYRSK